MIVSLFRAAALLITSTGFASADTCPEMPDRTVERQGLFEALKAAPDQRAAFEAANRVWAFWMVAPDEKAQAMLNDGMGRREAFQYVDAEIILDALTTYCPNYAEGWNQRAFVRFLRDDFEGSLEDIERTLALEPNHFGALSGKAQALFTQGKSGLAKLTIIEALKIHPWLNERVLVTDAPEKDI